jgi:hypothetical protein
MAAQRRREARRRRVASYTQTHLQLEELWLLAGGTEWTADVAAAIAQAESGGCQYALAGPVDIRPVKACTWTRTDGENSVGLWQINLRAHPTYSAPSIFGLLANAEAAVAISGGGTNFRPWTTYVSGAYRSFLTSGGTPTPQPGTGAAPSAGASTASGHKGYADLRNSVARHLPTQLRRSRRATDATLHLFARNRKVKG